ncbi:hypothetical protein KL86CLO1_11682 [uncultured Eubacteriales bacterium]|uniref:Siphovirus-type tail component C-terminal domain-containing protein n=1 Tax=uncultured Eubacteriales bacterium TaxID=172733 RepID=A0A212JTB2_9FIRM|nr:hypothetical protein KL86CLO1_11682 [uncultured Eubacteriales bacterium]
MRSITWESDAGHIVHMGDVIPYLFKALTDDLGATAETAKAPRQDGRTTYHTALDVRAINVTGSLVAYGSPTLDAQAAFDRYHTALCQAFAPHRWGVLTYHTEDGPRQVRCRPIATPTFGTRIAYTCTLDIEFTTDSPYWESADLYIYPVGVQIKRWHFPMRLPLVFGSLAPRGIINNPTSEIIYPVIEVTSTAQLVTVTNETAGAHISINRPIGAGQKMVIQMEDASAAIWTMDESGVYRETEDVSHWLTLDSEPWGMAPGENVITISNEIPAETPITYIKYRIPYLGV